MRHIPNFITSLRLIASPILVWLLIEHWYAAALGIVLFAGLTDWLDGFAARRLHVTGKTGVILDPLADKGLLVTLFLTLGWVALIPLWLLALVIVRDLVIVTGAWLLRTLRGIRKFVPTMPGKVSTFFQIVFVLLVLVEAALPNPIFAGLRDIGLGCTAVFTAFSGIDYVRIGIRLTKETAKQKGRKGFDGAGTAE